jgi:hypothetical protein
MIVIANLKAGKFYFCMMVAEKVSRSTMRRCGLPVHHPRREFPASNFLMSSVFAQTYSSGLVNSLLARIKLEFLVMALDNAALNGYLFNCVRDSARTK